MRNPTERTGTLHECTQRHRLWRLQRVLLIVLCLGLARPAYSTETPREHINRLIREASGLQAIAETSDQKNAAFDQTFRSVYHDLILANQRYAVAVKRIDSNSIRQLGSPGSFATSATATFALDQLHARYTIEVQHERRVAKIHVHLRRVLAEATASPVFQAEFLRIYQELIVAPSLERRRCIAAEKSWIDSMDNLYSYASAHSNDVQLSGGMISISDPVIRQEFNERIIAEETRRQDLLKTTSEYSEMQARVFRALAIDPKKIGL